MNILQNFKKSLFLLYLLFSIRMVLEILWDAIFKSSSILVSIHMLIWKWRWNTKQTWMWMQYQMWYKKFKYIVFIILHIKKKIMWNSRYLWGWVSYPFSLQSWRMVDRGWCFCKYIWKENYATLNYFNFNNWIFICNMYLFIYVILGSY